MKGKYQWKTIRQNKKGIIIKSSERNLESGLVVRKERHFKWQLSRQFRQDFAQRSQQKNVKINRLDFNGWCETL